MNFMDPLVSVVVPIYNTEAYLEKCLNSVCTQTLFNIEIICVNDGSTDSSEDIIKDFCKKDIRIKLITKKNGGLSSARNAGLKCAKGKYCYFMDSDDCIEKNAMSLLYEEAEKNCLDILYFGGEPFYEIETAEIKKVYEKEKEIWMRPITTDVITGEDMFVLLQKNKIFRSSVCIQFFRTNFLTKNNLYFAEGYIHEDLIYTFQTTLEAMRTKCIGDSLFFRRLRPESIVTGRLTHKNFEGRFNTYIQSIDTSKRHITSNSEIIEAMADFVKVSFNNSLYVYKNISDNERKKIFLNDDLIYKTAYDMMKYDIR